ncbi:hypothetical protein HMPREF1210_00858 [Paenisporosarcina sp. HGH0030]|nr:hypothetical protein [Paenisporosarcina sp. HGH0030]EPD53127.1 hypothetical protein HMPREF1210_00858 [Paenisporosarcina sp. HGH0030]
MKRIAIISDIHGNMPALEAVFEDIQLHTELSSMLETVSVFNLYGYHMISKRYYKKQKISGCRT